jgi:hypothetical protein
MNTLNAQVARPPPGGEGHCRCSPSAQQRDESSSPCSFRTHFYYHYSTPKRKRTLQTRMRRIPQAPHRRISFCVIAALTLVGSACGSTHAGGSTPSETSDAAESSDAGRALDAPFTLWPDSPCKYIVNDGPLTTASCEVTATRSGGTATMLVRNTSFSFQTSSPESQLQPRARYLDPKSPRTWSLSCTSPACAAPGDRGAMTVRIWSAGAYVPAPDGSDAGSWPNAYGAIELVLEPDEASVAGALTIHLLF